MSLKMVVGEDFPRAHWMLDGVAPYADYSGYERNAVVPTETNLAANPQPVGTGGGWAGANTPSIVAAPWDETRNAYRISPNGSSTPYIFSTNAVNSWEVGDLVYVSAMIQLPAGRLFSIDVHKRTGNRYYNNRGNKMTATGSPQFVTRTFVLDEVVAANQIDLAMVWTMADGSIAGTAGDMAYMGDVFISKGIPTSSYFDGETNGGAWTGGANNSSSWKYVPAGYGTSLAKGAERSLIVNNSRRLTVDTPVFKQGKEYLTFSVEAFVRPIFSDPANIAEQQIWGNDGVMDGLTINGTVVSFVTKYTDGSEARASFDLMDDQSFAAVGIHTERKNILYINGEQVAEAVITPEQKLSTFVATGENQSCGASTAPNSLMMNSLSVYDLELDEEAALTHYANAQDVLGAQDVAIDYKGALLEFAPEGQLAPFFQIEYSSDAEWQLGTRVNCAINDGTLYPSVSQGVSVPGYWETVVPLGASENQIYAANLIWEGVGATVTTSRDGELYEPAQKGKALTTIPKGTNGENEFLFIRVAFEGGMANDPSFFDNMVFSLYTTGTISNFSGREVVLDKATPEDDLDVIDFQENWGVELEGGTVTIKAPVGDMGIKARTIEVWGLKNGTWTNNLGAANRVRTNGGAAQPWRTGEWQLFHYVFDSDFTGDIVFSGTGQIGHVVLYPEALSDAVIKEIYDCYTGKPKIQVEVDEVFDVHEFPGAVDIYEYDWSIESSG